MPTILQHEISWKFYIKIQQVHPDIHWYISCILFCFVVGILYFKQGAKNEASPIEKSMCDQFLDLVYVWYVKL